LDVERRRQKLGEFELTAAIIRCIHAFARLLSCLLCRNKERLSV